MQHLQVSGAVRHLKWPLGVSLKVMCSSIGMEAVLHHQTPPLLYQVSLQQYFPQFPPVSPTTTWKNPESKFFISRGALSYVNGYTPYGCRQLVA
jgi:hypothetical protein